MEGCPEYSSYLKQFFFSFPYPQKGFLSVPLQSSFCSCLDGPPAGVVWELGQQRWGDQQPGPGELKRAHFLLGHKP